MFSQWNIMPIERQGAQSKTTHLSIFSRPMQDTEVVVVYAVDYRDNNIGLIQRNLV